MPELPEAERARSALEAATGRRIVAVDDSDTYVSRPHQPGEIAGALRGHEFVGARRRGKFLWLETDDGPTLGLHLGMAGRIVVDPADSTHWDRFRVDFDDGGAFVLRDKRRLGRAVLNPNYSHVGPDAALVDRDDFRRLIGRGRTAVKARLLNQGAISGVGNLLADEALWLARISPTPLHRRAVDRRISIVCGANCGAPCARQSSTAACTPAGSSGRGRARATVRGTATRSSARRSAAGPPTGVRSARSDGDGIHCLCSAISACSISPVSWPGRLRR